MAGLLLSTAAAFTATAYAVVSCRFLNVAFRSDTGDFEQYFLNQQAAEYSGRTGETTYRTGIGLFKWLRPVDSLGADWTNGQCAGYSESMLQQMANPMFDAARVFGVLAALMAFVVLLWSIGTSCLALNRIQIVLFSICCCLGTVSSPLTFLFTKSSLCETLFLTRECSIDEGALVMIVGSILWLITSVISVLYMRETELSTAKASFGDDGDNDDERLTPEQQGKLAGELARQKMVAKQQAKAAARAAETGKTHADDNRNWKKPISTVGNKPRETGPVVYQEQAPPPLPPRELPRPSARSRLEQAVYAAKMSRTQQAILNRQPRSSGMAQERQARSVTTARATITVDDVTKQDEMEVFFTPPRRRPPPKEVDLYEV